MTSGVCLFLALLFKNNNSAKNIATHLPCLLFFPNICNLENPSAERESLNNITSERIEIPTTANHPAIIKPLTYSNVAILIPDSVEFVSSQQIHQDYEPAETSTGGDGTSPVTEAVAHCEIPPMTRQSIPVDTDCHEAATSNHSEETSLSQVAPVDPAHQVRALKAAQHQPQSKGMELERYQTSCNCW